MITLLFGSGRIVLLSPIDRDVGYPFEASTTTTEADSRHSGLGGCFSLSAIANRCVARPFWTRAATPCHSESPNRALNSSKYGSPVSYSTIQFRFRTP